MFPAATTAEGLQHQVTVIARDPHVVGTVAPNTETDDGAEEATVTITIKNVNEAPMVTGGLTKHSRDEGDSSAYHVDGVQPIVGTYTATDPEITVTEGTCTAATADAICKWSLTGPDAADFNIGKVDADFGQLSFKKAPDYEKPIDADMDNVYMVTVVVTDSGVDGKNKMTATRDVVIEVTNVDEHGSVTYSSVQPLIGVPFTATLSDPDGMATDIKWQWWITTVDDVASDNTVVHQCRRR